MCTEGKQEEVNSLYELVSLPKESLKHHNTINGLSKELQVYIKGLEFKDNDVVDNKDLHENILSDLHYLLVINRDKFSKEEYVKYIKNIDKPEIEEFEEFAVKVSLDSLYEETLEEYVTLLLIRQQLIDGKFGSAKCNWKTL